MNKNFLKLAVEGITKYKSTRNFVNPLALYLSFNKDSIINKLNSKSLNIKSNKLIINDFELYKINRFKIDNTIKKDILIDSVNTFIFNNLNFELKDIKIETTEVSDNYNIFNVVFKFIRK